MIKLAIISDDPGRGGAYKVAADIAQELDKNEYEVQWFFLCDQPEESPVGYYLGSPAINIDYSLKSYFRLAFFPKTDELRYEQLNIALADYRPDIIHFHTHPIFLSLVKGIRSNPLLSKAKVVFTDHLQRLRLTKFPSIQTWLMAVAYKKLFQNVFTVFISKYAYETATKLKFADPSKDTLIENSVDVLEFSPIKKVESNEIKVVYLARLHAVKGHHILLGAWKSLNERSGLSLNLYGQENDGGGVRMSIEKDKYSNPVYYHGVTSKPEIILQNADIGVFPSYREGLPLALLEMMACGLPVVASDIPEIKSIITNGIHGLLFECGNSVDMANKINLLIHNEKMRHRIGAEARKLIMKSYGHSISEKYHHFYQSVL